MAVRLEVLAFARKTIKHQNEAICSKYVQWSAIKVQ